MQDEITIDLKELTRVFVVCPNSECGAEIGFDLTRPAFAGKQIMCPACGHLVLQISIVQPFNATPLYFLRKLMEVESPRIFFRLQRPAQTDTTDTEKRRTTVP